MRTPRLFVPIFVILILTIAAGMAFGVESHTPGEYLFGGGLLAALTGGATWLICRRSEQPLREIQSGAERFAQGQFQTRIELSQHDTDPGGLADTLNRMAKLLNERINTITLQRNEQQAILASMMEGVLAVDANDRVLSLNAVAARLFGVDAAAVRGKLLQEVVRIPALQEFAARTLNADQPQESEFTQDERGELRHLQVHGAALRDAAERRLGALIVINDITRLRRLESLQREFVANVSHELKTPITSIKGFIETLQDGAVDNPEDARRFLAIVAKHADRLSAIIEDLLLLSRIEEEADSATLERSTTQLKPVLQEAADACALRASEKQVRLTVACPEELPAAINLRLFTQVLINLIDNAVKYSEPGTAVEVTAETTGAAITVAVRDHGCGIDAEHLPRLGERFYRVDKARSRKVGGTGLGLAIARQILQAHGGTLTIRSKPGEGSTFALHLPAVSNEATALNGTLRVNGENGVNGATDAAQAR